MEVQAVAGRPFLPHVYVLPHGAVPAADTQGRQQRSDLFPVWLEVPKPPEILKVSHRATEKKNV